MPVAKLNTVTEMKRKNLSTSTTSKLYRSELLSELELREYVTNFTNCFPQDYLDVIQIKDELHLEDTRVFKGHHNRYLDSSFKTISGYTIVVEFKRGKLTTDLINECAFVRGYFELCHQQVPNFKRFFFVSESIADDVPKYCELLTNMNSGGIQIISIAYETYLRSQLEAYAGWAKNNLRSVEFLQVALECKKTLPDHWMPDNWFLKIVKESLLA